MSRDSTDAPDWLYLPGTLCDMRVFGPLRAALKANKLGVPAQVLPVLDSASREDLATSLVRTVSGSFIVVGFSLGCQIALEIVRRYPKRCVGLVLISTTARADVPDMAASRRGLVVQFDQLGTAAFVKTCLWKSYVASPDSASPDVKRLIFEMAEDTDVATFASQIELAISRPSSLQDLSRFACPVLMINGSDDVMTPPELGEEIVAAAMYGTHRIIPEAGHFVLIEQPGRTAAAIQNWVETSI